MLQRWNILSKKLEKLLPWNWRMQSMSKRSQLNSKLDVGLSDPEKTVITVACQRFIDEVLKPRFLPTINPTQFNYLIDILGNLHRKPLSVRPALSIRPAGGHGRRIQRSIHSQGLDEPRPIIWHRQTEVGSASIAACRWSSH